MPETLIPEGNPTPPDGLTILDIVRVFNSVTNKEFPTRFTNINDLLSPVIEPTFEHIQDSPYTNAELGEILTGLTRQTLVNSKEILYLHRLLALLIFELLEQGIPIENKELINEIKIYLNGHTR